MPGSGMEGDTPMNSSSLHPENGSEQDDTGAVSFASSESGASENIENGTKAAQEKESKMFFSFTLLSSHTLVRKQGKAYRCDVCTLTYRHVFSLKRHFLRNHVTRKFISLSDLNNCKISTKGDRLPDFDASSNSSSGSFSKDSQSGVENSNEKDVVLCGLYRCHMCKSVSFDTRNEITDHYLKHPTKSRFNCEKCNVVFSNKQALYRHLTSHAGESSFPCTTCSEIFDSKVEYLKHVATHTDGRTCKYCFKILSTKANKCRHERIHEGLKPYPCKHCTLEFSQSADLKKHIIKLHAALYIFCTLCTGLFSSKAALKKHMLDRHQITKGYHSSPNIPIKKEIVEPPDSTKKKAQASSSSTSPTKKKSVISSRPPLPSEGLVHCTVCRKPYRSYIGMMHHRRKAHPFATTGRKVHKRKKYYTRSKQKVISQTNSKKVSDEDFYKSISTSIAENLLNYVDGKTSQLSLRQYNFSDQIEPVAIVSSQPWSTYNFPSTFDVDKALLVKGQEVKNRTPETNCSSEAEILNGFSSCSKYETDCYDTDDLENSDIDEFPTFNRKKYADYLNINLEERKKMIGREVDSIIVCNVCKERISSRQAFEDHSVNNHPNVVCNYIEIEGEKDMPPVVPDDMRWQFLDPVGVFFSCSVPPSVSEKKSISCTKCKISFSSVSELHEHIISCGGKEVTRVHVKKTAPYRKIKRTMKKRINLAWVVNKIKKKLILNSARATPIKDRGRPPSKEKLPTAHNRKTSSNFKFNMGRPKNNMKIICPHCHQAFKTKALLNSHINRCYKRLVMKSKCPNVTVKKAESIRKQPQGTVVQKSIAPKPIAPKPVTQKCNIQKPVVQKSVVKNLNLSEMDICTNFAEENNKVLDIPLIEVPAERLSPSLELIVNSIKEKLTSEELSPSNPTFSWMEDESFIAIPKPAKNMEVTKVITESVDTSNTKPNGGNTLVREALTFEVKGKISLKQQKKAKHLNVTPVVDPSKTYALPRVHEQSTVMKLVAINTKPNLPTTPDALVNVGSIPKLMSLCKGINETTPKLVDRKRPVTEQSTATVLKPANFYKKTKVLNKTITNLDEKMNLSHKNHNKLLSSDSSLKDNSMFKKVPVPSEVLSISCHQTSPDQPLKPSSFERSIDSEKSTSSLPKSQINETGDATKSAEPFPDLSLLTTQIQFKSLKSKVASLVSSRSESIDECDDLLPIDVMEIQQVASSEEPKHAVANRSKQKCPYCLQDIAYLTTFHRHIAVCAEKNIKKEADDPQQLNKLNLLVLPKKDEVEESMISLLRHQSRQSKMMKEAQTDETADVKNFQAYTCESCHKIFFSLFKLLQHRVVHKLQGTKIESDNQSSPSSNSSDVPQSLPEAIPGPSSASEPPEIPSSDADLTLKSEFRQPIGDLSICDISLPIDTSDPDDPKPCSGQIFEPSCSDQVLEPSCSGEVLEPSVCEISNTTQVVDLPNDVDELEVEHPVTINISEALDVKEEKTSSTDEVANVKQSEANTTPESSLVFSDIQDADHDIKTESVTVAPRIKRRRRMKTLVVRKRPLLFKKNMKEKLKLKKQMESSPVPATETNTVADLSVPSEQTEMEEIKDENMEQDLVTDAPAEETVTPTEETVTPAEETVAPAEETVAPAEDTVTPVIKSSTKKSTSDDPINRSCPICSKVFNSKGYIKRHIAIMHSAELSSPKPSDSKPKKVLAKNTLQKKKKKKQMRNVLRRICKKEVPSNKIFVKKHLLNFGKIRK